MPASAFERLGLDAETKAKIIETVALCLQQPLVVHDLPALEQSLRNWWAICSFGRAMAVNAPRDLNDPGPQSTPQSESCSR